MPVVSKELTRSHFASSRPNSHICHPPHTCHRFRTSTPVKDGENGTLQIHGHDATTSSRGSPLRGAGRPSSPSMPPSPAPDAHGTPLRRAPPRRSRNSLIPVHHISHLLAISTPELTQSLYHALRASPIQASSAVLESKIFIDLPTEAGEPEATPANISPSRRKAKRLIHRRVYVGELSTGGGFHAFAANPRA
jgi:hypothetical protein